MNSQFWLDQITATQAQIIALNEAIVGLTAGAILSYSIDTGQTKTVVTKADVWRAQAVLDGLLNRLATLEARMGCGGSVYVRPVF